MNGHVDPLDFHSGPDSVLSHDQEEQLVCHMEKMVESHSGCGYKKALMKCIVWEIAFEVKKKYNVHPLSNNLLYVLLRRKGCRLNPLPSQKVDTNETNSTTPEPVTD